MISLRDFIAARLDEDEQIARNASSPVPVGGERETWSYDREAFAVRTNHGRWNVATRRDDPADSREIHMTDSYGEHIARHDPARVLREVAAKRRILELADEASCWDMTVDTDRRVGSRDTTEEPYIGDLILRQLAQAYNDHPDFNPEWRTT